MSNLFSDTIVGISTALTNNAVSIIRVSGDEAVTIVNKIFQGKNLNKVKSHTVSYGHIIDIETKEIIDEVLVSVFLNPRSYTKEDVVEINCHGGIFVTNQVLDQVVLAGARLAEAGEFTKRAFLNGRIDLTKAEAVMDMISSDSKKSLSLANSGLRGDIKKMIDELRSKILDIISIINVNIDYPEYDDVEQLTSEVIKPRIIDLKNTLKNILDKSKDATIIKNGINTVIVGKPNVGKSSILNLLLSENKAIVTNIPGTTRDIVEGKVTMKGITLNLIDTAGIRETEDIVEKIGVEKSISKIEEADLILFVFDGSKPIEEEDLTLLKMLENKKYLKVVNKNDLEIKLEEEYLKDSILINTVNENSIATIEETILKFLDLEDISQNLSGVITNTRQIGKIKESYSDILEALNNIEDGAFIDFVEIPLKSAWTHLGEITGSVSNDNLLDELFSKFCLGK